MRRFLISSAAVLALSAVALPVGVPGEQFTVSMRPDAKSVFGYTGVGMAARADRIRELDIGGSSGEDGEFVVKAVQVQLGDDAVVPLLQDEAAAFNRKLTRDQFVFALGQLEAFDKAGQ